MVQKKGRKTLFTALAVLAVLLLIIAAVAVIKSVSTSKSSDSSSTAKKDTPAISDKANSTQKPASDVPQDTTSQSAIDPSKVTAIDIEPMLITVSYMKGVGGFDFAVQRTASGTKYVQFSSSKLVGTKCTNDEGVFASILESPTADESSTLTKTTVVDGTTYGLSLADATCTSNPDLLKQYQDAFSEPFSLLKKM
jgi:cytoskeletal protein RodZ